MRSAPVSYPFAGRAAFFYAAPMPLPALCMVTSLDDAMAPQGHSQIDALVIVQRGGKTEGEN